MPLQMVFDRRYAGSLFTLL